MIVFVKVNATGRVGVALQGGECPAGYTEMEAPEGFTLDAIADYLPQGNALVYDPLPAPEEQEPTETLLLEMAADHEYRLCLMELGVHANDL